MGINTVSKSKEYYRVGNLLFTSRSVFSAIESIDRNLRYLYSPAPPDSGQSRINHSPARDVDEAFDAILDRVEKWFPIYDDRLDRDEIIIVRFGKRYPYKELAGAISPAFNRTFLGIMYFLYEARDLPSNNENHFDNRISYIANSLWGLGICPDDF